MAEWQDNRKAGCQAGKDMAEWQDDMMAGWQDDRVEGSYD
jgi:hypothetical protein